MTKKILFLLTFLLTTLGGGQLWAGQVTFNLANGGSSDTRVFPVSLTTSGIFKTGNPSGLDIEKGQYFELTADAGYSISQVRITFTPDGDNNIHSGQLTSITIDTDETVSWGQTFLNKNYSQYGVLTRPLVEPQSSIKFSFNGSEGWVYVKQLEVTYSKVPYSGTVPYTWNFHYGGGSNYWPNTTGEMLTANSNSKWSLSGTTYNYQLTPSSAELLDGNNKVIDETKGLLFTASHAGDIFTGLQYEVGLKNSAKVTIPAKAGQKIEVHAHWPKEPMTLTNATENSFTPSSEGVYTYNFTATDDNVTLQVNSNTVYIYSIAVKNDFAFSEDHTDYWDGNTTFYYTKSAAYNASGKFSVQANVPAGASISKGNFTVTSSSNSSVINVSSWGIDVTNLASGEIWFNNLIVNGVGTDVLTFTYGGSDAYNSKSFTVTVNVYKGDPLLTFTSDDKDTHEIAYAAGSYSGNPLTYRSGVTTSKIEYSSNDTYVASIDKNTGAITINNAGKAVIRAVFEGNAYYNGAETFYTLYAKGTSSSATVTWNNSTLAITKELTIVKAENSVQTATSSDNATVYYKSSDSDIVTVNNDGKIYGRNPGVATVTAYTKGSGSQEGAETSCTVTVNGGVMSFEFVPSSGTMTVGCQLMPRLKIPSLEKSDITSLTLSVVNESVSGVVTVVPNLLLDEYLSMAATRIEKVYPLITANTAGTATVRATLESPYYDDGHGGHTFTTDFTVTVTTETALFNWRNGSSAKTEYTITEGEYMMMPSITGNANGNIDGLSNGSVCQSRHGYVYSIINGTPEWNNHDYYYGQGVPDYSITPANGTAYIFWAKGEDTNHPVLMIYGKSAGDVTLRATDSQTGFSPADITIHVVSKADRVTGPDATFWSNKTFPFTWDFTNISAADITDDDVHWRKYKFNQSDPYGNTVNEHEHILGMTTSFPYDYADEDNNGVGYKGNNGSATAQLLKKYFVNGEGASCKIMPAFHGLRLQLGNNADGSFWSKRDKVTLYDKDDSNGGRLFLDGGSHFLYLPAMPAGNRPASAYRLYMKLKGRSSDSKVDLYYSEVEGGVNTDDFVSGGSYVKPGNDAARCYYFDIPIENAGKKVALAFDKNVEVYWIAFSTEEKTLNYPKTISYGGKNITTGVTYAANTYSYNEDLDIVKSSEANEGVTAYYASSFTVDKDAAAGDDTQYAVTMTPANSLEYVKKNTGLLLKKEASGSAAQEVSCYMIANPRNVDTYSADEKIDGTTVKNYLVGTGTSSISVQGWETVGIEDYTNFLMAYAYKYYLDLSNPSSAQGDYRFDRDWSFYPAMETVTVPAQRAYLRIPQNVYVDKNGNLVVMPSSSRRGAGNTAEAPATKASLSIVFDDEPLNDSGTTGISTVSERNIDSDAWFTLQGVRVNAPAKGGIYIHKGRKVVVK